MLPPPDSNVDFPREQTIKYLVHIIQTQPKLSKSASTGLIDIGEALQPNATRDEIDVLLRSTLYQEPHVRNSALQALQPFDLTDFDWSPELWIAVHDEDEQNSRLARHVWEDNGLDVPENYITELLGYLGAYFPILIAPLLVSDVGLPGHENAYVRTSAAAAIAEAAVQWPQTTEKVVNVLQDYYRDKARILAPEFDEYVSICIVSHFRAAS